MKENRGALAKSPDLKRLSPGVYRSDSGALTNSKGTEYKFSGAGRGGDRLTQAMNTAGQALQGGGQYNPVQMAQSVAGQAAGSTGMAPLPQGMTPEQLAQMVASQPGGQRDYATILSQMDQQMAQQRQLAQQQPAMQTPFANPEQRDRFMQSGAAQGLGYGAPLPMGQSPQSVANMVANQARNINPGYQMNPNEPSSYNLFTNKPMMFNDQNLAAAGFGRSANHGGQYRLSPGVYGTQEQAKKAYMQQMMSNLQPTGMVKK